LSPNGGMTDAMVAFFKSKMPTLKRVAVLGRDDVFPKSMAQGTSAAAKKAGLDVVYDQLYADELELVAPRYQLQGHRPVADNGRLL
jgi:branched-chain amino acid transport system substrate-binding protein